MGMPIEEMRRTLGYGGKVTRVSDKPNDKGERVTAFNFVGMGFDCYIRCEPGQLPRVGQEMKIECECLEFKGECRPGALLSFRLWDDAAGAFLPPGRAAAGPEAHSAEPPRRSSMLGGSKVA